MLIDDDTERHDYPVYLADWRRYETISDEAFRLLSPAAKPHEALQLIASARPLFDLIRSELDGLVALKDRRAMQMTTGSTAAAATTVATARLCMIAAVLTRIALMLLSLKDVSIARLTATMKSLASGDMQRDVPYLRCHYEAGAMAGAVQVFKASMIQNRQLEREAASARIKLAVERRHVMLEMADHFEAIISGVVDAEPPRAPPICGPPPPSLRMPPENPG